MDPGELITGAEIDWIWIMVLFMLFIFSALAAWDTRGFSGGRFLVAIAINIAIATFFSMFEITMYFVSFLILGTVLFATWRQHP